MKLLTDGQMGRLMEAWQIRFTRLQDADGGEVKQTLDLLFMPYIKPYLEIYNAGEGFSSLPSFGERGLDASAQGTPHAEAQEPILDKLGIAGSPCSFGTIEGPSSDDNTSSPRDDARSSERLDVSLPTTPLQSPFGTSSVDELQLGDGALEDTNTGFFDDAIAAPID
jgi:hypothetical protein